MVNNSVTLEDADRILDAVVEFPDINAAFQRIRPITNFRKDDDEARILYLCRRVNPGNQDVNGNVQGIKNGDLFVLKCKVQAPSQLAGGLTVPIPGPSQNTLDELQALKVFAESSSPSMPHLVAWKKTIQDTDGIMPGGYISYVVMTLMPGEDLLTLKFWSMPEPQQEEIRDAFVLALKEIWRLGFEPYDTALRNVLWEPQTRILSIVDFEHWHPATKDPINMNEHQEMQRWGILKRPLPYYHWQVWRDAATMSGFEHKWY